MKLPHPLRAAIALATLSLFATLAPAAEVSGVKFDEAIKVGGKELKLNGLGVRSRAMFKVYAMGLYLGKKENSTEAVLAAPGPRRFTLVMLREISGEDFGQAFMSGINANSDKAEKSKLMNHMVKLGETFQSVGGLKKGDTVHVDWLPEKGATVVEFNGKTLGEPLPEQAFYNALLKIWLGEKPADSDLKPLLLGRKPDVVAQHGN